MANVIRKRTGMQFYVYIGVVIVLLLLPLVMKSTYDQHILILTFINLITKN